jgi:hypothetical protein
MPSEMKRISDEEIIDLVEAWGITGTYRAFYIAEAQLSACQRVMRDTIREIYNEVICPMCYRLNPQHATMDFGKACHSCEEKSKYLGRE